MTDLEKLVAAFASIARPEIRQDHTAASCIASTWITIEVMRHFQVAARPWIVKVNAYNRAFVELEQQLGRRPRQGESNAAWVVGLGFEQEKGGIGAHVVAILDNRVLVDASIDQVNDPGHGLVLPGVVWTRVEPGFPLVTCNLEGHRLTYIPHTVELDFASLSDWNHNPQTDAAVARILDRLKALGFSPCGQQSLKCGGSS